MRLIAFKHWEKHRRWYLAFSAITLLYVLLMTVPWNPQGYGFGLDESWAVALHLAFAKGIQFGQDFVYTYGPYGFLQTPKYHPDTWVHLLIGRIFIALALWAGLLKLIWHCIARRDFSVVFLVPLIGVFPNAGFLINSCYFIVVTLPLILYFYVNTSWRSPTLMLTIIASALVSLVKHTFLTLALINVCLIAADDVARRKRLPVIPLVYFIALFVFWVLASQNLANIPAYITNNIQIISGYSATMGKPGPLIQIWLYLISSSLFVILVTKTEWKHRGVLGVLPVLGLAAILFLTFKGAFIRHDSGHAIQAAFTTVPTACLFSAMLWPEIRGHYSKRKFKISGILLWGISFIALLFMGSTIMHHYMDYGYGGYYLNSVKQVGSSVTQAVQFMTSQANPQKTLETSSEKVRKKFPLPNVSGTVDLYPNYQSVIFAYGFPYKPRPIIQSFSAYTSELAKVNASHLRDSDAPDKILFDIATIDGRLPSSDDGLSWPELLTLYDITDVTGRLLVLQRNLNPREYSLNPLSEFNASVGEWVEIPDLQAGAIWAQIDASPGLLGKLASAGLKLPPLYMEVETADDKVKRYRVLADVMNAGLMLSPILDNRWDFANFATSDWQQKLQLSQVKRIRLVAEGAASLVYPQSYSISLSRLKFPRQNFSEVVGWKNNLLISGTVVKSDKKRRLTSLTGPEEKQVFKAHAEMRVVSPLPKGSKSLSIGFGILDGAWQQGATDGVEFRVTAIKSDGTEQVLFSRKLQPTTQANDRGIQQATISLTDIDANKVALETLPGNTTQWDWSYWSQAEVR